MSERFHRSYDFTVSRAETTDDGLTLEGYAAVFNQPTSIRDWLGEYEETIAPGAFTRSINAGRMPLLQFDHGTHSMIGSIPIGVVRSLKEDENGLYVRARLSDNWLVEPVRQSIADGAINGMSFQFEVTQEDWDDTQTERTIREVKLYELGPVVWPAYEQTTVGVRSEIATALEHPDELARALYMQKLSVDPEPAENTSELTPDNPPLALVVDKKTAAKLARIAGQTALPSDYLKGA